MPTELKMEILPGELTQIVESVFGTMLKLEVLPCETDRPPVGDRMTASVHLTGDWNGAALLECDRAQACSFAGRFLSVDPPAAVDDVVRDVLGELANMIGGNLKCVLSPGIHLSMPSVMDGGNFALRLCKAEVLHRLAFQSDEGIFWVTIAGAILVG